VQRRCRRDSSTCKRLFIRYQEQDACAGMCKQLQISDEWHSRDTCSDLEKMHPCRNHLSSSPTLFFATPRRHLCSALVNGTPHRCRPSSSTPCAARKPYAARKQCAARAPYAARTPPLPRRHRHHSSSPPLVLTNPRRRHRSSSSSSSPPRAARKPYGARKQCAARAPYAARTPPTPCRHHHHSSPPPHVLTNPRRRQQTSQ
jgi:hypothetical protein